MADNPNYIHEFGDSQLPKKITNTKQERGHPLKEENKDAQANNWVEENYDPHHFVRRFPDGTQLVVAWGKNPRTTMYHSSGFQMNIFPDGTMTMVTTGNKFEMNKGGSTTTTEGHADHRGGGHSRENHEGGVYVDAAGDSATHIAGNQASHVAGNSTTNVSGDMSIRGNKRMTLGTQDDNGQLAMSIDMNNGRIQIQSKGDLEISSSEGAIKLAGKSVSIHGQDTIALNAGSQISSSAPTITNGSEIWKTDPPLPNDLKAGDIPGSPGTSQSAEKGVHDGVAESSSTFDYQNTLSTEGVPTS